MNLKVDDLVEAIRKCTETITISVPDRDYYARAGDTVTSQIEVINPAALINYLHSIGE